MTNRTLFFLAIIILSSSCNNQNNEVAVDKPVTKPDLTNCYQYVNNRDTITLKTIDAGDYVTGTLVYNLFEKDKNTGTIQGKMKDRLLVADYSFNSEGVKSVRQIAFKKTGNTMIEGFGDITTTNDKTVFKNIDSLSFNRSPVLQAFDCNK